MPTRKPEDRQPSRRVLAGALGYFLIVFGAGFALALVRIPLLVPRFGERTAELMEMPVMLVVIAWAARWLARRFAASCRASVLAAGVLALALLLAAEVMVAVLVGGQSLGEYLRSRDPVAGSVYLVSLGLFAVAPALWHWRLAKRSSPSAAPTARTQGDARGPK
jgi:hypothetical protein